MTNKALVSTVPHVNTNIMTAIVDIGSPDTIQMSNVISHLIFIYLFFFWFLLFSRLGWSLLGRGPDMTLVHPPPHILANLYFLEPLRCPEYEIGL